MPEQQRTTEQVPENVAVLLDRLADLDEMGADRGQVERVVRLLQLIEELRDAERVGVVAPRRAPGGTARTERGAAAG